MSEQVRQVQVTLDKIGMALWPSDVLLEYCDDVWYDTACLTRGANRLNWVAMDCLLGRRLRPGERIVLLVKELIDVAQV